MRTLQEWMGHRDIATTERYAEYAPSQLESDLIERAWAFERGRGPVRGPILSESRMT